MLHTKCFSCPCSASNLAVPVCRPLSSQKKSLPRKLVFDPLRKQKLITFAASNVAEQGGQEPEATEAGALPENFCIIESRESVKNFANMQLDEIQANIQSRRNKIFLLMEEVRRLRIQQRLKGGTVSNGDGNDLDAALQEESYPSFIPFFPPVTPKTIKLYTNFYFLTVTGIILFGGLIAPTLSVKLGLGGMSYYEFIQSVKLPTQLAEVDPIVASFCGGAVGVLTSLLVVEANNAKIQAKSKCIYCEGTGYLTCGNCLGTGVAVAEGVGASAAGGGGICACSFCSGTGKVMCTACLCTGKQLATEHDPRVDPFTLME